MIWKPINVLGNKRSSSLVANKSIYNIHYMPSNKAYELTPLTSDYTDKDICFLEKYRI